jgi:hypothetical protein
MKPTKATIGMNCVPHCERVGAKVPADIVVAGTPMCKKCFQGISPRTLPEFLKQKASAAQTPHL